MAGFRRSLRATGVPSTAIADIAQETFLAAFRHIDKYDPRHPGATFRGWLWTVTRRRILDFYRSHRREAIAGGGSSALEMLHDVPDGLADIPDLEPSLDADISQLTRRAPARVQPEFEPRTWQMFQDAVLQGHTTAVVAERYGVQAATVRKAKSRILHRLRQELGDVC